MKVLTVTALTLWAVIFCAVTTSAQVPLPGWSIPKYVEPLPIPPVMTPSSHDPCYYEIGAYPIEQQVLPPPFPKTRVWGYGTSKETARWPAATIEVTRGVPIRIRWTNNLVDDNGYPIPHPLPIDTTLHWANPLAGMHVGHGMPYSGPVPIVTHVHGGEQEAASDGHPDAWFTPYFMHKGPGWVKEVYEYSLEQPATTLFYHDHALGITRLNVYMGLAGFFIIRDPANEPANLPAPAPRLGDPPGMRYYEIPLAIQDRMFDTNGQLYYPAMGVNPSIHPFWVPEFFGDVICVNGKPWPYLEVEPRKYRFRIVNGSNARFYTLYLSNNRPIIQIGTDGGYLPAPVTLRDLTLAPGERADVIVDFSGLPVGTRILLKNGAKAPYPHGTPPDPQTTAQVMEFRVVPLTAPDTSVIPPTLNTIPKLTPDSPKRVLTLTELMGPGGPIAMFLDGRRWDAAASEVPRVGSTEVWEIVNLTADTHPIHLHLVQFQLLNRQKFQMNKYMRHYMMLNPVLPTDNPVNPPIEPYLQGKPMPPAPNEMGWKDTIQAHPGEVTRIIVRFAPIASNYSSPGVNLYPFDPTAEPGYVWHCHILEHEDNEMMRPLKLQW
ncbi:MAG: multicopper oxidase domain-containing protein [Chthonomonadetes bacterium]|nr:multicopper oxidase domain-containing protein [Chthonomonadetes bacterium]